MNAPVPTRTGARLFLGLLAAIAIVIAVPATSGAQYGGLSGLYVIVHPDDPGRADFSGLGCNGGEEVVLYMPGIPPTASDPTAGTAVPGRILAVTTAVSSPDRLLDGTFVFENVVLPTGLVEGVYEIHARCGSLDLAVLVELGPNGVVVIQPTDPDDPIFDEILNPTEALAFTGRGSNRMVSIGALLAGTGMILAVLARRREPSDR